MYSGFFNKEIGRCSVLSGYGLDRFDCSIQHLLFIIKHYYWYIVFEHDLVLIQKMILNAKVTEQLTFDYCY